MGVRQRTSMTVEEQQELLRDIADKGLDRALEIHELSMDNFTQLLTSGGLSDIQTGLIDTLLNGDSLTGLPQDQINQLNDVLNRGGFFVDRAQDVFQTGGFNDQLGQIYDRGSDILSGNTLPQQASVDAALGLLQNRGVSPELSLINDRSTDILNSFGQVGQNELVDAQRTAGDIVSVGGRDAQSNELLALGKDLVASGGFTPGLTGLLGQLSEINAGFERSPEFNQLYGDLQGIVDSGGEAGLIPINSLISMGSAEVAQRGLDAFQQARTLASRTGMRPGASTVGSGALAEASQGILAEEGQTTRDLLQSRDVLSAERVHQAQQNQTQLVQSQIAADAQAGSLKAQLADSIARAASANLGSATALLSSVEASSVARLNSALSAVATIGSIFAQRESTAFNSLLQSDAQAQNRVLSGLNALDVATQNQLAGGGLALGAAATAAGREATILGTGLQAQQQQINGLLGLGDLTLQGQGLDLSRFGMAADIAQHGQQNQLGAGSLMNQQAGQFLDFASPFYQQMGQLGMYLAQVNAQRGPWGNFAYQFGSSLGSSLGSGLGAYATGGFANAIPSLGGLQQPALGVPQIPTMPTIIPQIPTFGQSFQFADLQPSV